MEVTPSLDDLQKHTVKELREILRRENQPSSGKKADLVLRCQAFFQRKTLNTDDKSEEDVKKTKQPLINVISTTKSNGEITYELLSQESRSECQWSKDLRKLPSFNLVQLYEYLVNKTAKYNHTSLQSSAYKKLKAYQFFKEGHIKDLEVGCGTRYTYVKGEVLASMKQDKYKAIISFDRLGNVLKAACTCRQGKYVFIK